MKDLRIKSETTRNYISDHIINLNQKTVQESAYNADSINKPFNTDDLILNVFI